MQKKQYADDVGVLPQTVKKVLHGNGYGKEDSVKETQEGCLSRSINKFFEHFPTFLRSKNLLQLVENEFFDKLSSTPTMSAYCL